MEDIDIEGSYGYEDLDVEPQSKVPNKLRPVGIFEAAVGEDDRILECDIHFQSKIPLPPWYISCAKKNEDESFYSEVESIPDEYLWPNTVSRAIS